MKKYLALFIAFCLVTLAVPDIYSMLPASLRAEEKRGTDTPAYAVECICGGERVTLPLEEYVCIALAGRGYADLPAEALKALACIERTRVIAGEVAAVEKDVSIPANVSSAVKETENLYISYGGAPIDAAVHQSSHLRTAGADEVYGYAVPYLVSAETPEEAPVSEKSFTAAEMAQTLKANGYACDEDLRLNAWLTYVSHTESGRVGTAWLCGNRLSGSELARMLGLGSACFDIVCEDGGFKVICRGTGDGVGLSVLGARVMAEKGSAFSEILLHYFKGVDILLNNTP